MAYRLGVSHFLCSRRFAFRFLALSLLFRVFLCVFCRRFSVSFVATPPLLRDICVIFAVLPCCVVCTATPVVVCVTFSPPVRLYLGFLCASSCFFEVVCVIFLYFSPLLPLWCRVSWLLLVCWCGVLVLRSVGSCWCVLYFSSVWCLVVCVCGSVRDFVVLLLLRVWLVVGWCVASGCSSVSVSVGSGVFWLVRFFALGWFCSSAVLGGSWSSSAVSGASRSSSFVFLLRV